MLKVINFSSDITDTYKSSSPILGVFEGVSADAEELNANNMFLGTDLWNNLFNSDEFKRYLKLGHYIGYLGHPEDPGCQDFKNACIVLKDAYLDSDNKIIAKFDLIDTPVGRIVKTFIDAGVQFGISVRGCGDVASDGYVDPDTFIFRGFDIVAFPAYDEAIPEFKSIAASSNIEDRKRYKAIQAAISKNLKYVTSSTALDTIKSYVNEKSDEYKIIDEQINSLQDEDLKEENVDYVDISSQQLNGLMMLYLQSCKENKELKSKIKSLSDTNASLVNEIRDVNKSEADLRVKYVDASHQLSKYKSDIHKLTRQYKSFKAIMSSQLNDLDAESKEYKNRYILASSANAKMKDSLNEVKEENLKYSKKIKNQDYKLSEQKSTISSLQNELHETIMSSKSSNKNTLNLNEKIARLNSENKKIMDNLISYQEAYVNLYASILGVPEGSINITASTKVDEVNSILRMSVSYPIDSIDPEMDEEESAIESDNDELVIV